MFKYVIRRLLQAIPLVGVVAMVVFILVQISGDPLAYLTDNPNVTEQDRRIARARFGLDDPLGIRFINWLIGDEWYKRDMDGDGEADSYGERKGILRGDFGTSIVYRQPVTSVIKLYFPRTLLLGAAYYVLTLSLSFALGIFMALRPYTTADNLLTGAAFFTHSVPSFLMALILVQIFAVQFKHWNLPYLPVSGMYDPRGDHSTDELLRHMVLPVLSLSLIGIATISRYVRAALLEVIHSDYVRTARAKGLMERRVVFLHALKNASLPVITLIGLQVPFVLGGAVITETIFSWPGMGTVYIHALGGLDSFVITAYVLLTAVLVVSFSLLTDLAYAWVDPRIRYSS